MHAEHKEKEEGINSSQQSLHSMDVNSLNTYLKEVVDSGQYRGYEGELFQPAGLDDAGSSSPKTKRSPTSQLPRHADLAASIVVLVIGSLLRLLWSSLGLSHIFDAVWGTGVSITLRISAWWRRLFLRVIEWQRAHAAARKQRRLKGGSGKGAGALAVEGVGSGPVVVPAGCRVRILAGSGLHHGPEARNSLCVNSLELCYRGRATEVVVEGPATAAQVLHAFTAHVQQEVARQHVLSQVALRRFYGSALQVGAAVAEDVAVVDEDLVADVAPLLPAPLSEDQLEQMDKFTRQSEQGPAGRALEQPPAFWAAPPAVGPLLELEMRPDPTRDMSETQRTQAVSQAWDKGMTQLLGFKPAKEVVGQRRAQGKGCDPDLLGERVYVAEWSSPFS